MSGYTDGTLIPLATPDGQALLAAATDAGTCTYSRLAPYWAPQVHRRRCGLRSAAVVLNTLAGAEVFAEDGWFDAAAVAGASGGAAAGNAGNGGVVSVTYADADTDGWGGWPAALRNAACDAAALLVNYEMRVAGQGDELGGHISPVAAWHPPTDRLLVMDVWPATGPVWVPTGVLAAAAATVDKGSGRSRGCVALTLGGRG